VETGTRGKGERESYTPLRVEVGSSPEPFEQREASVASSIQVPSSDSEGEEGGESNIEPTGQPSSGSEDGSSDEGTPGELTGESSSSLKEPSSSKVASPEKPTGQPGSGLGERQLKKKSSKRAIAEIESDAAETSLQSFIAEAQEEVPLYFDGDAVSGEDLTGESADTQRPGGRAVVAEVEEGEIVDLSESHEEAVGQPVAPKAKPGTGARSKIRTEKGSPEARVRLMRLSSEEVRVHSAPQTSRASSVTSSVDEEIRPPRRHRASSLASSVSAYSVASGESSRSRASPTRASSASGRGRSTTPMPLTEEIQRFAEENDVDPDDLAILLEAFSVRTYKPPVPKTVKSDEDFVIATAARRGAEACKELHGRDGGSCCANCFHEGRMLAQQELKRMKQKQVDDEKVVKRQRILEASLKMAAHAAGGGITYEILDDLVARTRAALNIGKPLPEPNIPDPKTRSAFQLPAPRQGRVWDESLEHPYEAEGMIQNRLYATAGHLDRTAPRCSLYDYKMNSKLRHCEFYNVQVRPNVYITMSQTFQHVNFRADAALWTDSPQDYANYLKHPMLYEVLKIKPPNMVFPAVEKHPELAYGLMGPPPPPTGRSQVGPMPKRTRSDEEVRAEKIATEHGCQGCCSVGSSLSSPCFREH